MKHIVLVMMVVLSVAVFSTSTVTFSHCTVDHVDQRNDRSVENVPSFVAHNGQPPSAMFSEKDRMRDRTHRSCTGFF